MSSDGAQSDEECFDETLPPQPSTHGLLSYEAPGNGHGQTAPPKLPTVDEEAGPIACQEGTSVPSTARSLPTMPSGGLTPSGSARFMPLSAVYTGDDAPREQEDDEVSELSFDETMSGTLMTELSMPTTYLNQLNGIHLGSDGMIGTEGDAHAAHLAAARNTHWNYAIGVTSTITAVLLFVGSIAIIAFRQSSRLPDADAGGVAYGVSDATASVALSLVSAALAVAFGKSSGTLYTPEKSAKGTLAAFVSTYASNNMLKRASAYDYCSSDPIYHTLDELGSAPRECDMSASGSADQCSLDYVSPAPTTSPAPTYTGKFEVGHLPTSIKTVLGGAVGYTGTLPSEIGLLTEVTECMLFSNAFTGPIPSELGRLTKVEYTMDLFANSFTSSIPTQLASLSRSFMAVRLSHNHLTGWLPTQWGRFVHVDVEAVEVHANSLTGNIPTQLGQLTMLTNSLFLDQNSFEGPIPTEFGQLTHLQSDLWLADNKLTSSLPTELGGISRLASNLILTNNPDLEGAIPTEFGQFIFMFSGVLLDETGLSSSLPTQLARMSDLSWSTSFEHTKLCGSLPTELSAMSVFIDDWNISHSSIGTPCAQDAGGRRTQARAATDEASSAQDGEDRLHVARTPRASRASRASRAQLSKRGGGRRTLGSRDCPSTCFGYTCDEWLPGFDYFEDDTYGFTCEDSERDGCDCTGCTCGEQDQDDGAAPPPSPPPSQLQWESHGHTPHTPAESQTHAPANETPAVSAEEVAVCSDLAGVLETHGMCVGVCAGKCNCARESNRHQTYPSLFSQCTASPFDRLGSTIDGQCSVAGLRDLQTAATSQLWLCILNVAACIVLLCFGLRFKQLRQQNAENRNANSSDYQPTPSMIMEDRASDEGDVEMTN